MRFFVAAILTLAAVTAATDSSRAFDLRVHLDQQADAHE